MRALALIRIAAGIVCGSATLTTPADAAIAYLARNGSGASCTLLAPCNSMGAAVAVAGAGGEVICLDRGNYGGLTITASVTISCGDGLWEFAGAIITTPAGADVVIEGLVSDGQGFASANFIFNGRGTLHLHRVRMGNFSGTTHAINFAPTGAATLHVSDSVFYNSGGSGIHIRPTGSGYANVHIRNVKFERNGHGLFIDGSGSTIGINASVAGSVFAENSGNGIGAYSTAGGARITVSVKDSQITGNLTNGLGALGAGASGAGSATIAVGSSMISANVTGIAAAGAGQIRTFGDNQVQFNANNGAFTGSVGLQ